eukprot:CAMPEP_0206141752 /NCGR_PEP_ID=MMETSP1473-20131121/13966_1 /ASSEMBLY_ACC=CAM_ASM_001109 /TAXON_ID=1461547 /ORGANISM="Stichococcus sp, Strain RCC1054" /LENGTH=56 /DNA_ID=CAMNT_0053536437 /DNA_START=53 /DNA_END=219 /DNA_ORIENTATION=+
MSLALMLSFTVRWLAFVVEPSIGPLMELSVGCRGLVPADVPESSACSAHSRAMACR